jgi:hypothetical protein
MKLTRFCLKSGKVDTERPAVWLTCLRMTDDRTSGHLDLPDVEELLDLLERTTQLSRTVLGRVVEEVVAHHREPVEQFVKRRHRELQAAGEQNPAIWRQVSNELVFRVVAPPPLTERQLRRIVYG